MVGDDDYCVVAVQVVQWGVGHVECVVAALADGGKKGIVVGDFGAAVAEQLEDGERRGFAEIVDIAFVGQAED